MYPWDLSRFPNYAIAKSVDHVPAERLVPAAFMNDYIMQGRPCVIDGAAARWPATRKWQDPAYLIESCGRKSVLARVGVVSHRPRAQEQSGNPQAGVPGVERKTMAFGEYLHRVLQPCSGDLSDPISARGLFTEAVPGFYPPIENYLFASLLPDIQELPFCRGLTTKVTAFPRWRAFVGRATYSDWHLHAFSEQVLVQIVGTKEILLLPDGRTTFQIFRRVMDAVAEAGGNIYGEELIRAVPQIARLWPSKVTLEPGNALYIPSCFWHAVMARTAGMQFSVVSTYDADLKFGFHRPAPLSSLRHAIRFVEGRDRVRFFSSAITGYATSLGRRSNDWLTPSASLTH